MSGLACNSGKRRFGVVASALVMLSACAGVPWGEGGAEPPRATTGALVRTLDQGSLERASSRLATRLSAKWGAGAKLVAVPGVLQIDWRSWELVPGMPRVTLPRSEATSSQRGTQLGLVVHIPLSAAAHEIEISNELLGPCTIRVIISDGELDVPVGLTADKLGRVQAVVYAGATFHALSDATPNAVLQADLSGCVGALDPGAHLAALASAFADAAVGALGQALALELPSALGLDVAFAWSGAVNADAMGTGFMRTSLRALTDAMLRRQGETLQIDYALAIEADSHPCMGSLGLPVPRPSVAAVVLPAGGGLHLAALERLVASSWVAGGVCADHLGVAPVQSAELVAVWPELARLDDNAVVSLELWPGAVPRVSADPGMTDGLVLDTGRIRVDIIATHGGARWRAASVVLELRVAGSVWLDAAGALSFDPAAVEATPISIEAGLLGVPSGDAIATLVPTLVEALVVERALAILPAQLTSGEGAGMIEVSGDFLSWPVR